jgi:hypothetical protein
VVGGSNVDVSNFNVADTSAAGVYIATEGSPYFTLPVDGVRVSKGSIRQANQNPDVVHGAILIVAADTGAGIRNVSISDVDIAATSPTAGRDVAIVDDGGSIGQVALSRIHIADDALPPFVAQADPADYRLDEWTVGGKIVRVG